jgi:hypothetical protein
MAFTAMSMPPPAANMAKTGIDIPKLIRFEAHIAADLDKGISAKDIGIAVTAVVIPPSSELGDGRLCDL